MKLWSLSVNGKQLSSGDYKLSPKMLTIQAICEARTWKHMGLVHF